MTQGNEARRFLRAQHYGVLSTVSRHLAGYPFGSVAPYVTDHEGGIILLISTIAEHTKNIDADPRVSLLVHESGQDIQANTRLTVLGEAARMEDQEAPRGRYLRHFPDAVRYFETHDFFFYRVTPRVVRFIGGFGKVYWIDAQDFLPPATPLAAQEDGILAHMNRDHEESLRRYCRQYRSLEPATVEMVGVDCDGFDLHADGQRLRFAFPDPVIDAHAVRRALVAMAMSGSTEA
ncbi:MAG: DUF2470 domain-containing protein [Betaproteobacteria bacterium]|nr:DUF2470 domain-containing protein [Betaproteobacteria bacterium]